MRRWLGGVRFLTAFAALQACIPAPGLRAQEPVRIGHVNTERILIEAPGAPEAEAELGRLAARADAEVDEMSAEFDSLVAAYERERELLLPNIQQARETEITQSQARHQERIDQMAQELQQLRVTLFAPIVNQMTALIEAVRQEEGYHLVFEMAGAEVTAADPSLDITDEVLARMQTAPAAP